MTEREEEFHGEEMRELHTTIDRLKEELKEAKSPLPVYDMVKCGQGRSSDGRCRFFTGTWKGSQLIEGRCALTRVRPTFTSLTLDTTCRVQALSDDAIRDLMKKHQIDVNSHVGAAHASLEYRRNLDDVIYLRTVHGVKQTEV